MARRCGTQPLSRQVILSISAVVTLHAIEQNIAGTTYHEDDAGRRVTFDSRAGGATGRTASTSAAWPSECCCRCSSSSSGHEWVRLCAASRGIWGLVRLFATFTKGRLRACRVHIGSVSLFRLGEAGLGPGIESCNLSQISVPRRAQSIRRAAFILSAYLNCTPRAVFVQSAARKAPKTTTKAHH